MEKENKYYTPGIEEFCVGFEYESRAAGYGAEWIKETIYAMFRDGWESNIDDVLAMYEDGGDEFRVKYLDQQDIEDCGFGNKRKSVWDWYELNKTFRMRSGHHISKIKLIHDRSNEFLEVTDEDICPNIKIWGDFSGTDEVLFEGLVKNKTEFKKILKQIGVL